MQMEIRMARGDRKSKLFQILQPDGQGGTAPCTDPFDEIYFTVKKSYYDDEYNLQKRLSDGGITYLENGIYKVVILPADTDPLGFGEYDFDIEVEKNGEIKQTFVGKLILTKEVTYAGNEVVRA